MFGAKASCIPKTRHWMLVKDEIDVSDRLRLSIQPLVFFVWINVWISLDVVLKEKYECSKSVS